MRFLLHLSLAVVIALAVGFGLSWYALTDSRFFGTLNIGPWTAWRDVGNPAPDPYTRAYIARSGGLELGVSEGLQFIAQTDSEKRRLDRACTYRIVGPTPVARFWTLVPTDSFGSPVAVPGGPLYFASRRLARGADGSAELYVGKTLRPMNWLEISGDGGFELVLTLYDTQSISGAGSELTALPEIIREGCS